MAAEKIETVVAGNYLEMEREEENISGNKKSSTKTKLSNFFWHGGSVYDAWFSCASNQVCTSHRFSLIYRCVCIVFYS
jgi:auxin influx carrier (AUX1 LAX family)